MPATTRDPADGPDLIGRAIRAARTKAGLSYSELAAASGVNRTQISDIESGRRPGSSRVLEAVARAVRRKCWQLVREAERG